MKKILANNFNTFVVVVIFTVLFFNVPILFDSDIELKTRMVDFIISLMIWGFMGIIALKVLKRILVL